jgi:hypothetical protein
MRWYCKAEFDGYQPKDMVNWYNPPQSVRTGLESLMGVLFGPFNDRREVQAALDPSQQGFRYDDAEELWIDFVADVGDGWNSTYTIASMLAQDRLEVTHQNGDPPLHLPRARILIMGGDEVYPVAKREEYRIRTERPYEFAFPVLPSETAPHLFAIPGNHDWYDGLTSFLRVFSQRAPIGGWQTLQLRSYFALQLPHRWWLWAVDTQFQADLDRPQREYFENIAAGKGGPRHLPSRGLRPGDRVILCLPMPGWLYANRDVETRGGIVQKRRGPHEILAFIEEQIIRKHGGVLALTLAGDWHHYCRYESVHGTAHKITSGGGGAYALGTNTLKHAVPVQERGRRVAFLKTTSYPNKRTSKKLLWRNLGFAWLNRFFSWWILGGFYLFHAWAIQGEDLPVATFTKGELGTTTFIQKMLDIPAIEWLHFRAGWLPNALWEILYTYYVVLSEKPAIVLFPLILWISLSLFSTPSEYSYRWRGRSRWAIGLQQVMVGGLHAAAHIVLNLCLIWLFAHLNFFWLGPWLQAINAALQVLRTWIITLITWPQGWIERLVPEWVRITISWLVEVVRPLFAWIGTLVSTVVGWIQSVLAWILSYNPELHSWWQRLLYASEMIIFGGFAAGTLFGIYLLVTNRLFSFHEDSAFSSLRIPDYKNFLRLHLNREGLTVYPIGVRKVPRRWRKSNKQAGPRFEPVDRLIVPQLIEDPIQISVESVLREESEIGVGLSFNETMSGWFSMGETDPKKGAETAHSQRSKLMLELTVLIDSLDRFLCDHEHAGLVRGKIILPELFDRPVYIRTGLVKLFAPYRNTQRKSLLYELTFEYRGQTYHLAGEKLLEDDPGFDIWEDTTTLHTRLYEGSDAEGRVVGAGIVKITLRRFLKEMLKVFIFKIPFNFRPFNVASFREWFQAIAVYLSFFAAELWDVYVRRTKGYFVKFMVLSSAILGGFYLVHGWSIDAASEMKFMEKMTTISLSDWRPWYWPKALETIIDSYREVCLQVPGILIFPLTLFIGLTLYRRDNGVHTFLGVGNFGFYPSLFTRLRGIVHAFAQLLVNLVLIWAFVKVNISLFDLPPGSVSQRLAFLVEILFIGGTAAGFLFSLFRGVKLVRPYVG